MGSMLAAIEEQAENGSTGEDPILQLPSLRRVSDVSRILSLLACVEAADAEAQSTPELLNGLANG